MDARINPHELHGVVRARPSKSVAHRAIILAALADQPTFVACDSSSQDIDATIRCVSALGARISRSRTGYFIVPRNHREAVATDREQLYLDVGESGTTLRLFLPIICALGESCSIVGHGRLAQRPLSPLYEELSKKGSSLSAQGHFPLMVHGHLRKSCFTLPGDVSSQYVSGLLLAAPLLNTHFELTVREPMESAPYVRLTINMLSEFGITIQEDCISSDGTLYRRYQLDGDASLVSPGKVIVEGDWSNAAFWLAAGALSHDGLTVTGLNLSSAQGDRAFLDACTSFGATVQQHEHAVTVQKNTLNGSNYSLSEIPDLVAPLAAIAAHACGITKLTDAARLALKESNRLASISDAVTALGSHASYDSDCICIEGSELTGGSVDAAGDHRVAMMAAIAASYACGPTIIHGAECVAKSYPSFFEDYKALGGDVCLEA